MINTVVYFNNCEFDIHKEKLSKFIVDRSTQYLSLPNIVEIEYKKMSYNLYGETLLLPHKNNRFRVNDNLNLKEIVFPITHELIHLSQIQEGKLSFKYDCIIWNNRKYKINDQQSLSYTQQQQFPWESDVTKRQQYLLYQILKS